jgi:hypothetical protein
MKDESEEMGTVEANIIIVRTRKSFILFATR